MVSKINPEQRQKKVSNLLKDFYKLDGVNISPKEAEEKVSEDSTETIYELTEKGMALADKIMSTKGAKDMMSNPIMSATSKKPSAKAEAQKQKNSLAKIQKNNKAKKENKVKPKKDPNFTTMSAGEETPLKAGDSQANVLGKMYNFMLSQYDKDNESFEDWQKFNEKLVEAKEERVKELIGLFGGKYEKTLPKKKKEEEEPTGIAKAFQEVKKALLRLAGKEPKPAPKIPEAPAPKIPEAPAPKVPEAPAPKAPEAPAPKVPEAPAPKAPTKPTAKLAPETAPSVSTAAKVVTGVGLAATAGSVQAMIARHEGAIPYPYKDSKGLWTIGVGHLIGNGKSLPPEYDAWKNNGGPYDKKNNTTPALTPEQMQKLFDEDFKKHYDLAKKGPGFDKAPETVQNAFIDLTYNMGAWWTIFKQAAKSAEMGDFETTAKHMQDSKWYTQVGNRAVEIVSMIRSGGNKSSSTSPKVMPVQNTPSPIPDKLPNNASGTGNKPTMLQQNNTTNIVHGGTTLAATNNKYQNSPLLDAQYQ